MGWEGMGMRWVVWGGMGWGGMDGCYGVGGGSALMHLLILKTPLDAIQHACLVQVSERADVVNVILLVSENKFVEWHLQGAVRE